jgi:hypothetical protein
MISDVSIKAIRETNLFSEFRSHISEKISELNSVTGLSKLNNAQAGEEAKVREKSISVLMDIFRPFIDFHEKNDVTVDDIQKAKGKRGL